MFGRGLRRDVGEILPCHMFGCQCNSILCNNSLPRGSMRSNKHRIPILKMINRFLLEVVQFKRVLPSASQANRADIARQWVFRGKGEGVCEGGYLMSHVWY